MEVASDGGRLAEGVDQRVVDMVDLDRRKAQAFQPGNRACGSHETRQTESGGAVAIAAEVDAGEHDFLVPLRDPTADLVEHRLGRA